MKIPYTVILLAIALPNFASAEEAKIPAAVKDEVKRLEMECRFDEAQKKAPMKTTLDFIKKADLNDDGMMDYVLEDAYVECEAGAAFRHGNGGTGVIIFAGAKDGAVKAYDNTVSGINLEQKDSKTTAWISVGGSYCGQKNMKSRADAISCDRPLVWNAKKNQFDFAPLSKARFAK